MVDGTLGPAIQTLREHPKPVIAAVNGVANGGGCELVLLSDLAIASTRSGFALPKAKIGALPPIGIMYSITILEKKVIMVLAFMGEQMSAKQAGEMGVVYYTVESEQVIDVTCELAHAITVSRPEALTAMKDL